MRLFMKTTKIEAHKTVAEIQSLLGASGCSGVMTMYDENKDVKSVCFQIIFEGKTVAFNLPCRWQSIYNQLRINIKRPREGKLEDLKNQAKRVSWRQILWWVQAQLALVQTDMVKIQEVFLPYVQMDITGKTLYQQIEDKGFKLLGHSKKEQGEQ